MYKRYIAKRKRERESAKVLEQKKKVTSKTFNFAPRTARENSIKFKITCQCDVAHTSLAKRRKKREE